MNRSISTCICCTGGIRFNTCPVAIHFFLREAFQPRDMVQDVVIGRYLSIRAGRMGSDE